ncbi:MAG: hypothetical protein R2865_06910 [Deinococcales bacterium]
MPSASLGLEPKFIPVNLSISALGKRVEKNIEVVDDERFYAPLTGAAILQILDELFAVRRGGTVDIAWEIALADEPHLRILEQMADPEDIAFGASMLMAEPLAILADNIFKMPKLEKVSISLNYRLISTSLKLLKWWQMLNRN